MIWLFRFFVFLGALLVIALFSALLAPYFINWERFTKSFEIQATRIVGQQVKVGGNSSIRLLPLPSISFEDLEIGNNADGSPLMTVEQFSLDAELFPLLSGELRIVEMSMLRPAVNLQVEDNGTIAWTSPSETVVDPELVNIEKLRVNDGILVVDGLAGGRKFAFDNINGDFVAKSVIGPWRIEADAQLDGVPARFRISTGTYQQQAKSLRLKLEAELSDRPYTIALDGPVRLEEEILNWNGEFSLSPNADQDAITLTGSAAPLPVYTAGLFDASPEVIDVPEYRMEIGNPSDPYVLEGQGRLQFRDEVYFQAIADGRQINLDRVENIVGGENGQSFEARIATVKSILDQIPVPKANGEIDIILPAIVAGDTFVREVKGKVSPFGRGWALRNFSAIFPGNTLVEASGRVGIRDEFGFEGKLLVASRQPSGLAAWVSGGVDAQMRRLKAFGFNSDVTLSLNQAIFNKLELRLDDALLKGKFQRLAPAEGRSALIAELNGNQVNLRDLQALYSLTQDTGAQALSAHDLNIRIIADQFEAALGDVPIMAANVNAHLKTQDGNVVIEKLEAGDFYGATVSSAGRLERALERPHGNFKLNVSAESADRLLRFVERALGRHWALDTLRADPVLTRDTALQIELDTRSRESGAKGQVLVDGSIGGTSIRARYGFEGIPKELGKLLLDVDATLTNPSPAQLMRQFAIETLPAELVGEGDGPVSLKIGLKGRRDEGFQTTVSATTPLSSLAATGMSRFIADGELTGKFETTIGSRNLLDTLLVAGVPLPGIDRGKPMPVSLRFMIDKQSGKASFTDITGQIAGNTIAGRLDYQYAQVQRPRLSGELELGRFSLDVLADSVFGFADIFDGADILDRGERAFQTPLFVGKDANISLRAEGFDTGFGLTGTKANARLVMLDGKLDLNDVSLDALGTRINADMALQHVEGTILAELRFNFQDADMAAALQLAGFPAFANGRIGLNGSAETSGRTLNALLAGLSGNGIATASEVAITGMDPSGFDTILLQADGQGFEVNSEQTEETAQETILGGGGFEIAEVDVPFSITRGKARIRNLTISQDRTDLTQDIELDIANNSAAATSSLFFKPAKRNQIKGADPVVRFSWVGAPEALQLTTDASLLEGYLSLRAFEASQRRVETLEAQVLEKQRIQREVAFNFASEQYVVRLVKAERLRVENEEVKRLEEATRKLQEDRKRLAEETRLRVEEEERKRIEAERLEAERLAEEERLRKEAEAKAVEAERQAALEEEQRRLEAERAAAEALQQEQEAERLNAQQRAAEAAARSVRVDRSNVRNSEAGLETTPSAQVPSLRENIIENLENFLQGQ